MTKKRRRARSRRLPVRSVPRGDSGRALEVGGVTQSIYVPNERLDELHSLASVNEEPQPGPLDGYWALLLPPGCPRQTLLLGLGGGTVAHLLARRCPRAAIVGVDHDAEVLAVARAEFGLDTLAGLQVVEADAFEWVGEHCTVEPERFDFICLDLFEAGRLTLGALATPFLRQIATLLAADGTLSVNLMVTARTPEQVRRLRRVFVVQRQLRIRGNLVIHGRRPWFGERIEQDEQENAHARGTAGRAAIDERRRS